MLFKTKPNYISVVAVPMSDDGKDFVGRFILQNGIDLTTTILNEYKKRFNNAEELAEYLLKFHWYKLGNTSFASYMVSTKVAANQKMQSGIPIYIGETAEVLWSEEPIELVTPENINTTFVKTIYMIAVKDEKLFIFEYNDNEKKYTVIKEYDLKSLKAEASEVELEP